VDIDEARHNGSSARFDFAPAARQIDFPSLPDGGNLAALNNNYGVGNFFKGSERSIGVNDNRLHIGWIILLETRRNRESCCAGQFRDAFYPGSWVFRATFIHWQGSCLSGGDGARLLNGIATLRGELGLIDRWSKHLQGDVDAAFHLLPLQMAIRSGGC
jgi:hypothetical protein